MSRRALDARGNTMVEVVAAAVIGALMAGGTLTAFVTAIRISQRAGGSPGTVLLMSYADQLTNLSNCYNGGLFNTGPCTLNLPSADAIQRSPDCTDADVVSCGYTVQRYTANGDRCIRGSDDDCIHAKIAVELNQPLQTQ